MGLADIFLGQNNPFSQYVADNRNTIRGAFAGFGQGTDFGTGFGAAALGANRGAALDDAFAVQKAEEAKRQDQINQTAAYLREQGAEDLASAVEGGMMSGGDAFSTWYSAQHQPAAKPMEINGQLVDPMTGQVLGDYRDPQSGFGDAPSGYMWTPQGTQTFIPGGPADPANVGKTTEAQRRNQQLASVIQPELAAVEQNWDALANGGNQNWNNPITGAVTGNFASPEYQQAKNSLGVIAQSYLYSVSGAAATDAEVQKIVDSVTPKPFESPQSIAAKKARIQQMADAVIQAGGGGQPQAAPTSGVDDILKGYGL